MTTLTRKEHQLLDLLRQNARRTVSDLARDLNVSRPTLQNMLRKLEEVAIERYTVELKPSFSRTAIRAYVLLNRNPQKATEILEVIRRFPQVRYVCTVTGEFDVLVELQTDRYEDLEGILHGIEMLDGVERTQTYMVLGDRLMAEPAPREPA
ncbi:transcriptional regulator, AsnC family [Phenylobacterium zucineum HLK1]|uniref:Transcriptional regulator, AsnC family n=1 Tax=Phenylobacterium zucineum (strain HLK1) TaxID=450851 RepID=B4REK1_PHEZH|nr:Lrp/AsnC family transcriptional regulator [Phenylobacterium zucineum]ACG78527.1 transcriptional regulator, AsnC family [Phenylobacterium zucineum HLK1]